MAQTSMAPPPQQPHIGDHKRSKSSSVLKSIMSSKHHSRTQSNPPSSSSLSHPILRENTRPEDSPSSTTRPPLLHHSSARVLGEIHNPGAVTGFQSQRSRTTQSPWAGYGLEDKPVSMVSLQDVPAPKSPQKAKNGGARGFMAHWQVKKEEGKERLKKSKSSGHLAVRAGAAGKERPAEDARRGHSGWDTQGKENTTPPSSAVPPARTPIWEEFTNSPAREVTTTSKVPLNDRKMVEDEIARYMPKEYTPSKQRNFNESGRPPTLGRRERPRSECTPLAASGGGTFYEEATEMNVVHDGGKHKSFGEVERETKNKIDKLAMPPPPPAKLASSSATVAARSASRDFLTFAKKGSRVMGMVASFNNKSKVEATPAAIDAKEIDKAFEAVLESRNIPENMREKMRTLKTSMKLDFIRSHEVDISSGSPTGAVAPAKGQHDSDKPNTKCSDNTNEGSDEGGEKSGTSSKRSRARSKTFTFSKRGSASSKKQKAEVPEESTTKPGEMLKSPSTTSLGKASSLFGKSAKPAVPEEFVSYLRSVQKPQIVEVGKLHKLRQLLRNESVSWVDTFIRLGGMAEIVGLLHRIMEVEWREEHEDQLLHETLLCLKALCTTSTALQKLSTIEKPLFTALLSMLFDPENKGPSEFTTRSIILHLLFAHLSSALKDPAQLPNRVRTILSYLSDPTPPAEKQPLPFILDMRQNRPYKVWCQEIVNVTKDVFWIFMHQLNVVPLPAGCKAAMTPDGGSSTTHLEAELSAPDFVAAHFTHPRPPVPAAPYVGGVEWDATHYLAAHLDLLNGLVAALASKEARNGLRAELRASGFEKVMGATLRTCKEKFYDHVHDGLRTWVGAAVADGWDVRDVRMGVKAPEGARRSSPKKSPRKKAEDKVPVIEAPKLDLELPGFEEVKGQARRVG